MFSLFIIFKKEDIWAFLASSEDKLFFAKKEDMSFKRRTYGKPNYYVFLVFFQVLCSVSILILSVFRFSLRI